VSKFQKIAFGLFVALSLTLAFIAYKSLKNIKQPSVKALTLIPDGCEVLLRFDDYSEFTNSLRNKNLLWQDLQHLSCFEKLEKHFNYFDSLLVINPFLRNLISSNPVYFSLYPENKFLISCNLKELSGQENYKNILRKAFNSPAFPLKTGIQSGVIGISNTEETLKKLFDISGVKLIKNRSFSSLNNGANYSGVCIYVGGMPGIEFFNNSYSTLSTKPDKIVLNGIKQKDSLFFFGEEDAGPIKDFSFLRHIPLICNSFEVFAINNAEKVFENKTKDDWWSRVNEKAMFNAKKQFYNNIAENIIKVEMPSKSEALIMTIADSVKAGEVLPYIGDSILKSKNIFRLSKSNLSFVASTFPILKLNELNYIVVFNDHLVFTANETDAEIFNNAKENNSSIIENKRFKQFAAKNFDLEFHYLNYKLINSLPKEEIPFGDQLTLNDIGHLKNISHCSYVATYKNNILNYRFSLSYSQENFNDEPGVLWTMNTDAAISSKPALFKNHITKGNEIFFQTADNSIYLESATGKILWKKSISEQIRSDIYIVDAFKNGKYQMLFNTDKYLHLIDRNGNDVQGFPVKLPAKASNKLCLFDYEKKNDLRLFIACTDNRIYNYSIWGIKQEGFKTLETSAAVTLPIRFCKVGLSDYLVTADVNGKIYAFSRRGEGRIDFKNKLIADAENFEVEPGNAIGNTHIIYMDKKNNLLEKVSLNDKKEIFKISDSDGRSAYCFSDFDRNKITDVIIAYSDKLEVYDLNGVKIFSEDFSERNPLETNFYEINNQSLVSIFDKINSNMLIMNIEQKINKEYKTTQPALICDLFNDGKIYLLLVLNGELKCLKL
jgi:hypothetical protein